MKPYSFILTLTTEAKLLPVTVRTHGIRKNTAEAPYFKDEAFHRCSKSAKNDLLASFGHLKLPKKSSSNRAENSGVGKASPLNRSGEVSAHSDQPFGCYALGSQGSHRGAPIGSLTLEGGRYCNSPYREVLRGQRFFEITKSKMAHAAIGDVDGGSGPPTGSRRCNCENHYFLFLSFCEISRTTPTFR